MRYPCAVVDLPDFEKELSVVGDLHGQLQDVLHMFHEFGPPTAERIYLFNGNIADRGSNASEIFFLLAAYFLADPASVMINRGNHEDEHMNSMDVDAGGGFRAEVVQKFGIGLYKKFVGLYKVLPLCTVLASPHTPMKNVFIVHGGLSSPSIPKWKLTVDFIKTIDHTEFTMPDMTSTARALCKHGAERKPCHR